MKRRRVRRNPVSKEFARGYIYQSAQGQLRRHRSKADVHGSNEAVLAKLHAHLLWNYRQLREGFAHEGGRKYADRAARYRTAARHVKKALDVMMGYDEP